MVLSAILRPYFIAATIGSLIVSFGNSALAAQPRAVIELFTSQGCSSCPPADELLAELANDPDVIPLSLPVDYWDRLGWKDTFAQHAFTLRQQAYAAVRGEGRIYTPQAMINGLDDAVGSVRSSIDQAISDTAFSLRVPVQAERTPSGLRVSVGSSNGADPQATVVMLPIIRSRDVAIGRGENARRKVTYTNIVRDIIPLGNWSGSSVDVDVELSKLKGQDGVVVLLQAGSPQQPGAILGATRIWLR